MRRERSEGDLAMSSNLSECSEGSERASEVTNRDSRKLVEMVKEVKVNSNY